MIFRQTEEKDRGQVINLWRQAREYFRVQGIDQWQDGYPDEAELAADMEQGESYVLEESGRVAATAFISFAGEPDYDVICGDGWLAEAPYGVVHRIAVDNDLKGQGLAGELLSHAVAMARERGIGGLRVDTHADNRSMRRMLEKNGFTYRGVICLRRDGAARVAYERVLSDFSKSKGFFRKS